MQKKGLWILLSALLLIIVLTVLNAGEKKASTSVQAIDKQSVVLKKQAAQKIINQINQPEFNHLSAKEKVQMIAKEFAKQQPEKNLRFQKKVANPELKQEMQIIRNLQVKQKSDFSKISVEGDLK